MRSSGVRRVFREGNAVPGERIVVFLAPGDGDVATVAGRKVGGAVQRNRARRILREAFRAVAPEGLRDRDVVLVARSSIVGATSPDLASELRELLHPVGGRA